MHVFTLKQHLEKLQKRQDTGDRYDWLHLLFLHFEDDGDCDDFQTKLILRNCPKNDTNVCYGLSGESFRGAFALLLSMTNHHFVMINPLQLLSIGLRVFHLTVLTHSMILYSDNSRSNQRIRQRGKLSESSPTVCFTRDTYTISSLSTETTAAMEM